MAVTRSGVPDLWGLASTHWYCRSAACCTYMYIKSKRLLFETNPDVEMSRIKKASSDFRPHKAMKWAPRNKSGFCPNPVVVGGSPAPISPCAWPLAGNIGSLYEQQPLKALRARFALLADLYLNIKYYFIILFPCACFLGPETPAGQQEAGSPARPASATPCV
jgi:hypothetical protein